MLPVGQFDVVLGESGGPGSPGRRVLHPRLEGFVDEHSTENRGELRHDSSSNADDVRMILQGFREWYLPAGLLCGPTSGAAGYGLNGYSPRKNAVSFQPAGPRSMLHNTV